jgi:hypothetical protein
MAHDEKDVIYFFFTCQKTGRCLYFISGTSVPFSLFLKIRYVTYPTKARYMHGFNIALLGYYDIIYNLQNALVVFELSF